MKAKDSLGNERETATTSVTTNKQSLNIQLGLSTDVTTITLSGTCNEYTVSGGNYQFAFDDNIDADTVWNTGIINTAFNIEDNLIIQDVQHPTTFEGKLFIDTSTIIDTNENMGIINNDYDTVTYNGKLYYAIPVVKTSVGYVADGYESPGMAGASIKTIKLGNTIYYRWHAETWASGCSCTFYY